MQKTVRIINWIIRGLFLCALIPFGILYQGDRRFYYAFVIIVMASSLTDLVFMTLTELLDKEHFVKRFTPVLYVFNLIISVAGYYFVEKVNGYYGHEVLYWMVTAGLVVLSTLTFVLLNHFIGEKKEVHGIVRNR